MTCPGCQGDMAEQSRNGVALPQCDKCGGIFLSRSQRGLLVEAENDWHQGSGTQTQPLPRITADMTAPPAASGPGRARSFLDELFG